MRISFIRMVKLQFLQRSQWITFPTQSYLVLYTFCANLWHLLIIWLIVSSLLPHNQHLLFCCVLSVFAWTFVLMALFSAVIRKDSGSLLRFLFVSHAQVFSCDILFVCRLKYPYSCFSSHFCFLVIVLLLILVLFVLLL